MGSAQSMGMEQNSKTKTMRGVAEEIAALGMVPLEIDYSGN
jgi:hypothetical protein